MMIKIPNDAFTIQGDRKLSPDETITFSFLFKYRNVDDDFTTTIDLISQILKFKKGNDSENKFYIRDVVVSLQNKEYINCNVDELTKYTKIIIGKVINLEKGYSGIDSSVLDEFLNEDLDKSKLKFYIYADVNRFIDGNKLSYDVISSKCNYFNSIKNHSVRTIQNIVNELDGKFIYRFSGDRIEGSPEQEVNVYFSDRYMTEEKKRLHANHINIKVNNKARRRKDTEIIKDNAFYGDNLTVKELKKVLKESNWGKKDKFGQYEILKYGDYFAYRLAKDEHVAIIFVKKCEFKIESMNDDPECIYDLEAWEQEYLQDTYQQKETNEDQFEQQAKVDVQSGVSEDDYDYEGSNPF
ncbi:hypothetical protein [Paenibacillus sp. LPE1-1-1.1]|uniref:hypothetical protein n=1 Tax=Paenibacillus sp. LPE1-1-1.1 TaxID=3135230 RepID=UPI003437AA72